jgi:hypothetical protein
MTSANVSDKVQEVTEGDGLLVQRYDQGPRRRHIGDSGSKAGRHIGLAAEAQVISCSLSRCITARERRSALQVPVNAATHGGRPGPVVLLHGNTQPDITVQNPERSALWDDV